MAVSKVIRSNRLPQPRPQQAKNAGKPRPPRCSPDPHMKAELFDDLRQLNRGYGTALAALVRLQRPGIFPGECLREYRERTEGLRAQANRDLLRLLAGHEERDAERFAAPQGLKPDS
jgi:hypothetical protein